MSGTLNCCAPCATVQNVSIPGGEGNPGDNGTNGINAFAFVTAPFAIPAPGANVQVSLTSTAWMVLGQVVIIGEGLIPSAAPHGWANFQVVGLVDSHTAILKALHYVGDTATPGVLALGTTCAPAGLTGS